MKISEIFGPTIQGEGPSAGRHCVFVRLADCNLECNWCDTAYTWAFTPQKAAKTLEGKQYSRDEQVKEMSVGQVAAQVFKLWPKPTLVIVSGGEPLMQAEELTRLAEELNQRGYPVHVETAGTIMPDVFGLTSEINQFVVSPKLTNSGNRIAKRYKPHVLQLFTGLNSWFKFVARNVDELEEIDKIVLDCGIRPERVMVMPEGTDTETIIETSRAIASAVIGRGYGLSLRSHVFIWTSERGR